MSKNSKFNNSLFLLIFFIIITLNLYLFTAIFHAIVLAAILVGSFYPLFIRLKEKIKLKQKWIALIMTGIVFSTIIFPLLYIIIQVSSEAVQLYSIIRAGLSQEKVQDFFFGAGPGASLIQQGLEIFDSEMTKEEVYYLVLEKVRSYSGYLLSTVNHWLSDTLNFLFQFIIMIVAIYGLFLKGDEMKEFIFKLSPLPDEQEQLILNQFNQMNYVTMVGNGLGGLIQGVLAGIGFALVGFSSLFLWSSTMVILAFIPLVGISIITLPASIYLMLTGKLTAGILLLCYTTTISLVVENWFKPKFIGAQIQVDGIMMLLYIIAGMSIFGMIGIFYGPLLFILFMTTAQIFSKYYHPDLDQRG